MPPQPPARSLLALAACAALLSACGGDGDSSDASTDTSDALSVGGRYMSELTVEDKLVSTHSFTVYGVTPEGQLTDNPDAARVAGAQVHVPEQDYSVETDEVTAAPVGLDQLGPFVQAFWHAIGQKIGAAHPEKVWEHMQNQDMPIPAMYASFQRSGLDMMPWIDFYMQLDDAEIPARATDEQEAELDNWLHAMNATPATLLQTLADQGMDWPGFLARLQARQWGFADLREQWHQTAATDMPSFIALVLNPYAAKSAAKAAPAASGWSKVTDKHWKVNYWWYYATRQDGAAIEAVMAATSERQSDDFEAQALADHGLIEEKKVAQYTLCISKGWIGNAIKNGCGYMQDYNHRITLTTTAKFTTDGQIAYAKIRASSKNAQGATVRGLRFGLPLPSGFSHQPYLRGKVMVDPSKPGFDVLFDVSRGFTGFQTITNQTIWNASDQVVVKPVP